MFERLHTLGYVANSSTAEAFEAYYPGYAEIFTWAGKEGGCPPIPGDLGWV